PRPATATSSMARASTPSAARPTGRPDRTRRPLTMPTTLELRRSPIHRALLAGPLSVALALVAAGCGSSERGQPSGGRQGGGAGGEEGKTAGISVVRPERRDIRMTVVQPGTIQAFEVTPIYSRIAGYVEKYRYNIGDRVKAGDVLIDMWIPDVVEELG